MELHLTNIHLWKWNYALFLNILGMGIKFQHLAYYSGIRKTLPLNKLCISVIGGLVCKNMAGFQQRG